MSVGPAIPSFIFRGHSSAIHALHFFSFNAYLASGDSDGWIVIWSLSTKRPVGVWKGHNGGIMGLKDWQCGRLVSHGRDHKLRVWQVRQQDLENLSRQLPVEGATAGESVQPWLVHSMDINALNFCAFAISHDTITPTCSNTGEPQSFSPVLIATPNGLDHGQVDIFQLPTEQRVSKASPTNNKNSAMVMAVSLFFNPSSGRLTLVSGQEDGSVAVIARKEPTTDAPVWIWEKLFVSTPHKQPVLSVEVTPDFTSFITSAADAIVAKFQVPVQAEEVDRAEKTTNTKHAGQQDLKIRSDGKIFATAGWDKMVRVYSVKTLKELAILKWHQEGCYSIAFAQIGLHHNNQSTSLSESTDLDVLEKHQQERATKAQNTHWIVAGAKDGKISLWNIY